MKFGHAFSEELFGQSRKAPFSGRDAKRSNNQANQWRDGKSSGFLDFFQKEPVMGVTDNLQRGLVWRVLPITLFIAAVYSIFFIRLFDLEIINGPRYRSLSESNRRRNETVSAQRGVILDREVKILVRNAPAFKVILTTLKLEEADYLGLAKLTKIPEDELRAKVAEAQKNPGSAGEVILQHGLSRDETLDLESGQNGAAALVRFDADAVRDYLNPGVFAHLFGYLGEISASDLKNHPADDYLSGEAIGRDGLENTYENYLKGIPGTRVLETNAQGKILREISQTEPVAGDNLQTSLDSGLGLFAYEALQSGVKKSGATGGVAVAQDPRSGQILLSLSLPSFDPGVFSKGLTSIQYQKLISDPGLPLFNRAVLGTYPPGSVFKLVTALAALEEKTINGNTVINGPGAITVGSFVYRDWKPEGHGLINLVGAIAQSCDTCFYTIGGGYGKIVGVGPEKISEWAKKFRLGGLLGIDLPAEANGLIGDPAWKKTVKGEDWYIGNTYHMAIGQGDILATPLQINSLTATIANGGTLYRPQIVSEIRAADGSIVKHTVPEVIIRLAADPKSISIIKEGMAAVVAAGGTAYPMQGFPIKTGGKTGTSEFGDGKKTHAWFTVFAPFDNPEIALTVLLEGGGQGSDDAAPIARKILDEWLKRRRK